MGPLSGLRVIEMAGIGPTPFVGMLLSDMGADVIRIDRKASAGSDAFERVKAANFIDRGRRSLALDLKRPEAVEAALDLIAGSDALIEGFRPGVMERLGLGPDVCLMRNPKLVFGRVTGWGQQGPLAQTAGHDINYIAITGVAHAVGGAEAPIPPLNLIGDFGGGAMMLAFGLVCALLEVKNSGRGQVVDAAMTDGAALLMAMIYGFKANGQWRDARASNWLDGGAPFYRAYRCADGKFVAVGALEPQFFQAMLKGLGIDPVDWADRWDASSWPRLTERLTETFLTRPRDEWAAIFAATDACVSPILSLDEAPAHPHNLARATFAEGAGGPQLAPAPRFSRTPGAVGSAPSAIGSDGAAVLEGRGFSKERIEGLTRTGAL